ncbi:MAG: hypothetical protein RL722_522 [Pseudomonadota bacterium]|jgi:hypothetical protein
MSRPRVAYWRFRAALELARRLCVSQTEALELMGLAGPPCDPVVMLHRWRAALLTSDAIQRARTRAAVSAALAVPATPPAPHR